MARRGLVIAAPASGAGKTTVTLALLRALRTAGHDVASAKSGPDYIDPAFHAAACGAPSLNLDAWAMSADSLRARAAALPGELLIVEGAMGALDGAGQGGRGSAADLAQALGLPLVLVLDAAKQGASVTLPVSGLRAERPDLPIAGVILNRLGSPRHLGIARAALERRGVPLLGHMFREAALGLPERHLGLVQAGEHPALDSFLDTAAARLAAATDLTAIAATAGTLTPPSGSATRLPPPGQHVAIARDTAFAFCYRHVLDDWRAAGAKLSFFSPLQDQAPDPQASAIYLPGGYPELHAPRLAAAANFRTALHTAAAKGVTIHGECGGYMTLGTHLTDAEGTPHEMLGLLPVATSFAKRRLHLGYRQLTPRGGPWSGPLAAHEFHYATITDQAEDANLFDATDAEGTALPPMGHRRGSVTGTFAHIIGPR
ncbi:cobyrinate a,c-diamide synthase [Oceanibium sediminis]|uniref:cobyrinate a,c-diamide synthase n=1 Tax=Oceanibium sediminis TaxID=2026339 RepID=UPI000DD4E2A2|nr:cobyrinate a,c-diamide synthase [Oceanibium sediminis]